MYACYYRMIPVFPVNAFTATANTQISEPTLLIIIMFTKRNKPEWKMPCSKADIFMHVIIQGWTPDAKYDFMFYTAARTHLPKRSSQTTDSFLSVICSISYYASILVFWFSSFQIPSKVQNFFQFLRFHEIPKG